MSVETYVSYLGDFLGKKPRTLKYSRGRSRAFYHPIRNLFGINYKEIADLDEVVIMGIAMHEVGHYKDRLSSLGDVLIGVAILEFPLFLIVLGWNVIMVLMSIIASTIVSLYVSYRQTYKGEVVADTYIRTWLGGNFLLACKTDLVCFAIDSEAKKVGSWIYKAIENALQDLEIEYY